MDVAWTLSLSLVVVVIDAVVLMLGWIKADW
jgi:hypothetical protein